MNRADMSLSGKSAQEISDLLDEFGIKHGPVVDSTRGLYEKKIKEAMVRAKRGNFSPDKTFYREEEEEVTYTYRAPVRSNVDMPDRMSNLRSGADWSEREYQPETSYSSSWTSSQPRSRLNYRGRDTVDSPHMYDTPASYRSSFLHSSGSKPGSNPGPAAPAPAAGLVSTWVKILIFLAAAVFLYFVISNMETNESFKGIE